MTWSAEQIKWVRNGNYHGVLRSQNDVGHRFAHTGAALLRYIFNTEGSLAKCDLELWKLDASTQEYYFFCASAIDLLTYENHRDFVQVNLKEGGLIAKIKAFENTDHDIPITSNNTAGGNDSVPVIMPGIKLDTVYSWVAVGFAGNTFTPFPAASGNLSTLMGLGLYDVIGNFRTGEANSATNIEGSSDKDTRNRNAILKLYRDAEIEVSFDLNFYYENRGGNSTQRKLAMYIYSYSDSDYVAVVRHKIWVDTVAAPTTGRIVNAKGTHTILCAADDRLLVAVGPDETPPIGSDQVKWNVETGMTLTMKTISYTPKGVIRGYRPKQMFDKIIDKMTDGAYTVKSDYLTNSGLSLPAHADTIPYRLIHTSGDALRSLGSISEPPRIRTTFRDLYKNIAATTGASIGIENERLVIEKLNYFYRKDVLICDLGVLTDAETFEFSPAKDLVCSTIDVGYNYSSQNEVNGRDEFNVKQTYTTAFDNTSNKLDLVSPYIAGYIAAEICRLNVTGKKAPDANSDNDCFLLAITDAYETGGYKLEQYYSRLSGVTYPETTYNVPLSPKRNLIRNGQYIASILHDSRNDRKAHYRSCEKNDKLVSKIYLNLPYGDCSDHDFNDTPILFKPYVFSFDAIAPDNLPDLMNSNPYGVFGFTYKGRYYEGFVLEVGVRPAKKDTYRFRLLCSPDTDISGL